MRSAILESKPDPKPSHKIAHREPADFNRLARLYRWLEWFSFGPVLWRCRCAFLPAMNCQGSALIIGDGDGRFTARLLQQNSQIAVEAVDGSEAMLQELARRACCHANRLKTRHADARDFDPSRQDYELIATHFFLDCLSTDEVANLASRLRSCVRDRAQWVVSEFAIPKTLYGSLVARPLIAALYWAFTCLTGLGVRQLPDHATALANAGFTLVQRRKWLRGLLVSELWQAC